MSEDIATVTRLQGYTFELRVDGELAHEMRRFAGSCRFVFNRALALQQELYALCGFRPGYADLCKEMARWKKEPETLWLEDAPSQALQQSLKNLETAWERHFESHKELKAGKIKASQVVGPPQFKKKGQHDSFRFPQGFELDPENSRVFLPKLGWVRYRNSQEILGEVRNVTVRQTAGKWFISILTKREVAPPVHPSTSAVGIDMGVVRFATLSDGEFIEPLNSFKEHEDQLRKAQQALSRKEKYTKNWKKAKAEVQRIHARIANVRLDFLHKASTPISKNHAMVVMENLQVRNMSRSAAGTVEQPGRNVKQKTGLNKSILDQGWGEFRRQMKYKMIWTGGLLVPVPPQNTSTTCPGCGHISKENRRKQAQFTSVECGFSENADLVGAINILRAGYARIACQVNPELGGQQQEPTSLAA
jgi:putative transposase